VQTLDDIITKSGYNPPEDQNATKTITKSKATDALGKVIIQQLGVEPQQPGSNRVNVVEEWQLYNAWVKDVKYGELDYTSDDLTEITLTLRYDYAKLNQNNDALMGPLSPRTSATTEVGDEV